MSYPYLAVAGGFALAAAAMASPAPRAAAQAQPGAFAACAACHAVKAGGPRKMGPELDGVAGRPAGAKPGFAYSKALKASGIVWTDDKLDAYLAKPSRLVPGTIMVYPGMSDAGQREVVIAYLKSIK